MKLTRFLSILLILVAFGGSLLSGFVYTQREDAKRAAYYQEQEQGGITFSGPYCTPDTHLDLLQYITLLTGLAFAAALFSRYAFASLLFCLGALGVFLHWYIETQEIISNREIADFFRGLDRYFYKATEFDVVVVISLIVATTVQTTFFTRSVVMRRFSGKLP